MSFIGITVVALGTSLPELAASLVAAANGQTDIVLGNVVGSNIANVLGILSFTVVVQPIVVAPNLLRTELPMLLGFSILMLLFSTDRIVRRWEAGLLVGGYTGAAALRPVACLTWSAVRRTPQRQVDMARSWLDRV